MIIYTAIDTENNKISIWTEDYAEDYCATWRSVEFDSLDLQTIINNVKETLGR